MCGVIGYFASTHKLEHKNILFRLFTESKIRGLHAFGVHTGKTTLKSNNLKKITQFIEKFNGKRLIGHTRYSTSGDFRVESNNQPILREDLALVFNGVIDMGTKQEMESSHQISLETENDGEIFAQHLSLGGDPVQFVKQVKFSLAALWAKGKKIFGVRNNKRPLWGCKAEGAVFISSTADIFKRSGLQNCFPLEPFTVYDLGRVLNGEQETGIHSISYVNDERWGYRPRTPLSTLRQQQI